MKHILTIALLIVFACNLCAQKTSIKALSRGAKWEFNTSGKELSLAFRTPFFTDNPLLFTDADWQSGLCPLGYGRSDVKTPISFGADSAKKTISNFYLNDEATTLHKASDIDKVYLNILAEDGYAVFINGIEVARKNLSAFALSTTLANTANTSLAYEKVDITAFKAVFSPIAYLANTVAVEIHKANAASPSSIFDLEIEYEINQNDPLVAFVTLGPYLNGGTPNSAILRWYTNKAVPTVVKYGTNPLNLDKTYNNTIGKTTHEVLLNGLTPNTKYYYSLEGVPSFVNLVSQQYFKTSPLVGSEKPTRIWVIGDFGVGLPTQHLVYADYLARNLGKETDLWLWLGDNAYDGGTVSEYERNVFNIYGPTLRNHMLWPTAGNHDLKSCNTLAETGPYFDFFSLPKNGEAGGVPSGKEAYYSFDYANIHFICLESTDNNRMPTGPMVEWLKKDLRANNQKWTIAFWHHPPYSKGSHDSDNEGQLIEMRENVLPLLEKHGVDLVLSGHSHCYERSYLLNGHYGKSDSFDPESHLVQGKTDGKQSGDGAYTKPNAQISNRGTVYSVVGSSGSPTDFTTLDHPAHYFGSNLNGHMILEINGDSLTAKFHPILGGLPTTTDEFSIVKENILLPCDTVSLLGNDTLICQGNSLSLGVADDYLAYSWSTGENEPKIEVNKAGWYVLAAKVNGTCTLRDSIFVNIPSANLQPSNNALLCKGDSLKLVVDNNLSNITWSTLDSNTASIFVKNAGTYTVKGLSSEGCIVYDTLKLSLELPLAVLFSFPVNPARVNTELTFVDISPNSRSRTWSFGDGFSSSDSIAKHSYSQAGEYLVSLKAKGLVCEGSKSAPLRVENPNGLSEFNTENYTAIRIGEGLFTIQLNELVKLEKIKIYTANGQLVKAKISSLNNQLQIDLSQESPGVYLLKTEKINIRLLR